MAKGDVPLIRLRLLLHHLKNSFGSRQSRQKKVDLLGKLIHGHGALPHIYQIGGEASQVHQAGEHKQPAHTGRNRIIKVGKAYDGRHHHAGIGERLGGRLAQRLISAAEFLKILVLVIENLFHLLPADHFLHKAVDAAQMLLLILIILFAAPSVYADK